MLRKATNEPRLRKFGNDAIDALPATLQEWYHAIASPLGVGNREWAQECIGKGVDVNARLDGYGGNALFLAIEQGNFAMVKWLVEDVKVNIEALDFGGYNALDYAAACGFMYEAGSTGTTTLDLASYLKSQGIQHTWLGACIAGDIDRIWEFLDNGQDVNERGGHFNRNGCQEALDHGQFWTARFLMVKGGTMPPQSNPFGVAQESTVKAFLQGKLTK
mmetsp:Transcript_25727/g.47009  ORF Transcript_25727/g.47009 Transcript_25727/m.47009 type:complete len:218 (+) Transcript_25727:35-688(+)